MNDSLLNEHLDRVGQIEQDTLMWGVEWLCKFHKKIISREVLYAGLPRGDRLEPETAIHMLEQVGIAAGWVKRDLAKLSSYLFPLLISLNDSSYCIVVARKNKRDSIFYQIIVPENSGSIWVDATLLENDHTGYAMVATPKPRLDGQESNSLLPQTKAEEHWLFSTLWRYRSYFYNAALATILANVLTLATTFFTMNVYDRVIPTQAYITLWSLAIGVFIAIVFEFLCRQARAYLIDNAGKKSDLILGVKLFRQVMSIRMECKPQSSGTFANQLRDFEAVRDFVTSATLATLSDLPFCILFIFVIYFIGGQLALVPLLAIPIILVVSVIIQWPLGRYMEENIREISLKQGMLIECIEGLEALKAVHGEGVMLKRWEDFSALAAASSMKTRYLSMLTSNFVTFIQQITTVGIVVFGVHLIHSGDLTMGTMIGIVLLSSRALAPLASVVGLALRYQHAKTALKSLNNLMAMPTERSPDIKYLEAPSFTGSMELKNISFSYPVPGVVNSPKILENVNATIRSKDRIAILGRIGSGKSTLLRVMARLYSQSGGQILIDGVDINQIDPIDWRSAVGYVGQDCRLFNGSLRQNITIGNPSVSTDDFLRVARLTGVDAIAAHHPLGFDMQIGEMGNNLSGGQKQLVALARCLLLRPKILLMDEPTSSMDAMTEALFLKRLHDATQEQTLLIVTHRTSVLNLVDRVIVVEGGKIVKDDKKDIVLSSLNSIDNK